MTSDEARDDVDPISALTAMALSVAFDDLSDELVLHAKHCLLDTIASTIAGSAMEGVPAIVDLVVDKGGKPESVLPFYGGRYPAAEVALALGPMARAADCGNLHEEAGHVSEYIVPALLAVLGLRERVSGQEFLTALIVGQETLVRIGMAYNFIAEAVNRGSAGGHYIFGVVAAVGRLLGLTQEQLENAHGIARTMTQPEAMAIYSPATLMVRVHHGLVAQAAITACLLARRGITGPRRSVLMGPSGYVSSAVWPTRPELLTEDLGTQWQTLGITTKGYGGSYFLHSAVDGLLSQMRTHGFRAEDIASIAVDVSSPAWRSVCVPHHEKWNPRTVDECLFSMPYALASAAHDDELFLSAYADDAIERPSVREMMTRVVAHEDPSLTDWAARVTTRLRDGREFTDHRVACKGNPHDPFTTPELVRKFQMCLPYSAHPLDDASSEALILALLELEGTADVARGILPFLTPESS